MANFLPSDPFPIELGSESFLDLYSKPEETTPHKRDLSFLESASVPESNPRKKARQSSNPHPPPKKHNKKRKGGSKEFANKLSSKDRNNVNGALNELLKLSADHDLNYALGRHGHMVINRLVGIYDKTIGWKHGGSQLERKDIEDDEDDLSDLTPSAKTWEYNASPSKVGSRDLDEFDWPTFCATKFAPTSLNTAMSPSHINPKYILSDVHNIEHIKRLEIIVMIIRNLSFGEFEMSTVTYQSNALSSGVTHLYLTYHSSGQCQIFDSFIGSHAHSCRIALLSTICNREK